jgi:hypothetical protein
MGDAYQWRTQMYLAWMPIVDEKSRVVYEPSGGRDFNNLQDAGGAQSHRKERWGIDIGQLMDRRTDLLSCVSPSAVRCRRT